MTIRPADAPAVFTPVRALARPALGWGFALPEWNPPDGKAPAIPPHGRIGAAACTQWTDRRLTGAAPPARAA